MPNTTILVVENDYPVLDMLRDLFQSEGYRVLTAAHGAQVLTTLESDPPRLIIVELTIPPMGAPELLRSLQARGFLPGIAVIVTTWLQVPLQQTRQLPVDYVLPKPFHIRELLRVVAELMQLPHGP